MIAGASSDSSPGGRRTRTPGRSRKMTGAARAARAVAATRLDRPRQRWRARVAPRPPTNAGARMAAAGRFARSGRSSSCPKNAAASSVRSPSAYQRPIRLSWTDRIASGAASSAGMPSDSPSARIASGAPWRRWATRKSGSLPTRSRIGCATANAHRPKTCAAGMKRPASWVAASGSLFRRSSTARIYCWTAGPSGGRTGSSTAAPLSITANTLWRSENVAGSWAPGTVPRKPVRRRRASS